MRETAARFRVAWWNSSGRRLTNATTPPHDPIRRTGRQGPATRPGDRLDGSQTVPKSHCDDQAETRPRQHPALRVVRPCRRRVGRLRGPGRRRRLCRGLLRQRFNGDAATLGRPGVRRIHTEGRNRRRGADRLVGRDPFRARHPHAAALASIGRDRGSELGFRRCPEAYRRRGRTPSRRRRVQGGTRRARLRPRRRQPGHSRLRPRLQQQFRGGADARGADRRGQPLRRRADTVHVAVEERIVRLCLGQGQRDGFAGRAGGAARRGRGDPRRRRGAYPGAFHGCMARDGSAAAGLARGSARPK